MKYQVNNQTFYDIGAAILYSKECNCDVENINDEVIEDSLPKDEEKVVVKEVNKPNKNKNK